MNTQTIQNSWSDVKAKIKTKWSKFNDNELESFKDNLDKVSAQVQKTYGIAKEQAEKEFSEFKSSLQSVQSAAKPADQARIEPNMTLHAVKPNDKAPAEPVAMASDKEKVVSKAV